jgi:RNA polymerase sigma-70 factor, ECF subfamily
LADELLCSWPVVLDRERLASVIEYNQWNKDAARWCFPEWADWYFDLMAFGRRPTPSHPSSPGAGGSGYDREFADEALSYLDALYGTALRLTRRAQDAEDLVQDTYLKAFRASRQFQAGTNLKAWLFTILHNTFRNMRRHDGRNPVDVNSETVEQAADVTDEGRTPEQLLTRATLDSDLQAALDDLPDAFRQAVWLRDVEEFSYAEIAKIVDVPIGTVMSRISRGRRMLHDRLTRDRTDTPARAASG